MAIITQSTPVPVPTFSVSETDASLDQFLDFLRALVSQYLSDTAPRIPSSSKAAWVEVIISLTDHLLSIFPSPDIALWSALREKVICATTALDVVKRIFECVDEIHQGTSETIKKVFARLLNLCFVLDSWVEIEVKTKGMLQPKALRQKCFETLVVVLKGLGLTLCTDRETEEPPWMTLRIILHECLDVCKGM